MRLGYKANQERGFGLLELVIAMGILGGLIMVMAQGMTSQNRAVGALDQRLGFLGLKSLLLATVDCNYTLPTSPESSCTAGM